MPILFHYKPSVQKSGFVVAVDELQADRNVVISECLKALGILGDSFNVLIQPNGKPYVVLGDKIIQISISHTKNHLFIAVSLGGPIGLDVEKMGRNVHPGLFARIMCQPEEKMISPLRLWTMKEAFLKMTGTGLRVGMKNVGITYLKNHFYSAKCPKLKLEAIICHFSYRNFWISVSYLDNQIYLNT